MKAGIGATVLLMPHSPESCGRLSDVLLPVCSLEESAHSLYSEEVGKGNQSYPSEDSGS